MNQESLPSYEEFRKILTSRNLKEMQIIYFALGFGIVVFNIVLVLTYNVMTQYTSGAEDKVILFISILHFLILFAVILLNQFLFLKVLKSQRSGATFVPAAQDQPSDTVNRSTHTFWNRLRVAHIFRLALFESVAVFGLVVCTLAAFNGVLQAHPIYWLNLFSSLLFMVFLVNHFPTPEKLERFFREYVQGQSIMMD